MEVNELRIGNWIKSPIESGGIEAQVIRIETDKDGYSHYFDHCSPIPLTEEWLERCEVKQLAMNKFEHLPTGLDLECSYELKYVNQLQNLYFALTQQELIK
jgi:hypothetical protein